MRHLGRVHRVAVAWLHEQAPAQHITLQCEVTERHAADIYTKAFTDPVKWEHAQVLSGVFVPARLQNLPHASHTGGLPRRSHERRSKRSRAWKMSLHVPPVWMVALWPRALMGKLLSGPRAHGRPAPQIHGADFFSPPVTCIALSDRRAHQPISLY